jgi:hypothetical protein
MLTRLLPLFIDDDEIFEAFEEWAFNRSKETEILFLEDNPVCFCYHPSIILERDWENLQTSCRCDIP